MTPQTRRTPAALSVALVALLLPGVAACTSAPPGDPSPSSPRATSTATPAAGQTPPADGGYTPPPLVSTPVDLDCGALLDVDALASLWPGLSIAAPPATDDLDAPLAQVAEADGTVCGWTDAAGDQIAVGVAAYDADSLTAVANDLVASSNSVPTFGVEGYFRVRAGTGVAEALPPGHLVVAESTTFVEPGSAETVVDQVVAALPGAR